MNLPSPLPAPGPSRGALVLASLSGPDRPGILGEIMAALAGAGFRLVDVQQATLLDLLALSVLVDAGPGPEPDRRLLRAIGGVGLSLGLAVDARRLEAVEADRLARRDLYALTALSDGLDTATVAELAGELKRGAPSVQTLVKQLVTEIDGMTHDEQVADLIGEHVAVQCTTDDAIEGMSAFLNKRKPRWAA